MFGEVTVNDIFVPFQEVARMCDRYDSMCRVYVILRCQHLYYNEDLRGFTPSVEKCHFNGQEEGTRSTNGTLVFLLLHLLREWNHRLRCLHCFIWMTLFDLAGHHSLLTTDG